MMAVNVIPKAKTWTQRFERKTGVDEAVEFERNLGTVPVDVTTARYFFDIEIEGEKTLRLIFELFWSITPKTCRNFAMLCTGECGTSPTETALHYKGSRIHRVVAGQLIQGGDITCGNGRGGESIYGATERLFVDGPLFARPFRRHRERRIATYGRKLHRRARAFDDENFICKHNAPGLLSMANNGPPLRSASTSLHARWKGMARLLRCAALRCHRAAGTDSSPCVARVCCSVVTYYWQRRACYPLVPAEARTELTAASAQGRTPTIRCS